VLASCSDFSDYNDVPADQLASGNQTLWANIQQNANLSDFAALVKRSGFDKELDNTRTYTVWAPVNGTFNTADYQGLSDSLLLQRFVKSHVAEYGHAASGMVEERVHTLNEKSFTFEGNGTYTYGGQIVSQANLPSSNGVMHLLQGTAQFYPNLYEYLRMGDDIDSLRNHFLKYELTQLDTKNSVKGPIIGGIQTYIDSVVTTTNSLTRSLNASLQNEDSTYTFLMPTNKAYGDLYDKVKPLYKFAATTTVPDIDAYTKATDTKTKKVTVDAAYLSDSLARRIIVRNLVYSNNDTYNQWLVEKGLFTDTLRSTTRSKFSNPRDIIAQVKEKVTMSNGTAYMTDSLAFLPWELYNPEIIINPLYYTYTADSKNRFTFSSTAVKIENEEAQLMFNDDQITDFRFLYIYPTSDYAKPEVYIELPNVLSTTYEFYAVFLPYSFVDRYDVVHTFHAFDDKPNLLNFQINYTAANGNTASYNFSSKFLQTGAKADENPKSFNKTTAFENDQHKVDTLYLGKFTFPVAYNGLGDYTPNIHITNPIGVFNKTDMATWTRDVRLAAIIMKPVELSEYEKQQ
jgi:uncharacterized surface protein with fasciclin (FAS1) repeats